MTPPAPSLGQIAGTLSVHQPKTHAPAHRTHAAVAMILRPAKGGPEILFIERAHHEGDPWSGDLGFPGGRIEPEDGGARDASMRETREEIGVDLAGARLLGRLDDLSGAHLPIVVSCFVFALEGPVDFSLNEEVMDAFWVPLENLIAPERHAHATVHFRGTALVRPALRLLEPPRPVLWGITYRLVSRFLTLLGRPLPATG
ncbi:MAG: CoA pyrophosphatase [Desulfuromonas sp.]|uniref:NUDIX hydrolase n=1 Tax=Desulfuromonas sp. TaxID=892 RepID=UPI000CB0ECA0|nr:CoA pyrophosphatase [Desulfuromonas sp.]PLX85172.1 MAG: CoA pyrophosphatase [Desulfuromonas sp.]